MSKILIIDDDELLCRTLVRYIRKLGHEADYALTIGDGLTRSASARFDVVLLDVRLPDGNGLDALPEIMRSGSRPEVIIITGRGDPDGAEMAIKSGAWAYLEKPPSMENVALQLTRALQYRSERAGLKTTLILKRDGIIGSSPQLAASLDLVAQVARSNINVLLTGETGTGKELFARTIHSNSPQSGKNFIVVDCASLPESLVGSLLFGHEKGAYTGADKPRPGLVKEADKGTLFLDEVGELPMTVQKDFLRALQEHRFRPVGGGREIESDFRLLSATNRDLESMVQAGHFRKDLFFRLQSVTISIPPLRTRPQDIKELAMHYIPILCDRYGTETKGFSPEFFDALAAYDWPGNVRELINTMERVLAVARYEPTLFPRHLPTRIRVKDARAAVGRTTEKDDPKTGASSPGRAFPSLQDVRETAVARAEKQYLSDLMSYTNQEIKEACRVSGLSKSRLYHLLKKHDIPR